MNDDDQTNRCVTAMARGTVVFVYLIQSLLFLGIAQHFLLGPSLGLRRLWLLPPTGVLVLSFLGLKQVWRQPRQQRLRPILLLASAPAGWFFFWGPAADFFACRFSGVFSGVTTHKGFANFFVELFLAIGVSFICALLFLPKQERASTRRSFSQALPFVAAFLIGALIALTTPSLGGD